MKGLIPFYLIYCYGKTSLYTVFIKAVDSDLLINEDNIEEYGTLENEIFAFTKLQDKYSIYRGKAVNSGKALAETVALIHSAKKFSELDCF